MKQCGFTFVLIEYSDTISNDMLNNFFKKYIIIFWDLVAWKWVSIYDIQFDFRNIINKMHSMQITNNKKQ